MLNPIEKQSVNRFAALVIGQSGIGKTSLMNTILGKTFNNKTKEWEGDINDEQIFVLSAEAGLLSVRNLINENLVSGFEINTISDVYDAEKAFSSLETLEKFKDKKFWLFVDSLTAIAEICENELKTKYKNSKDTWAMWGEYADIMIQIIKKFRSMNQCHVIFTGLETIDKDQDNRRYAAPALSGKKLPVLLISLLDEIFYMYKIKGDDGVSKVVLNTSTSQYYPAKDRSGKLNGIELPNLLVIKNKIIG